MSRARGTKGDLWERFVETQRALDYVTEQRYLERVQRNGLEIKHSQLQAELATLEGRLDDLAEWATAQAEEVEPSEVQTETAEEGGDDPA